MPVYKYTAVAVDGTKKRGKMEAGGVTQLTHLLGDEGLFLVKHQESTDVQRQKKLKLVEVADFCRQLSAMLSSGITLIRAMQIIAQRDNKPHIQKVYDAVIADLQKGTSLSDSMTNQGKAFPELLINMMKAGESSGRMDTTASKMADQYDKDHRLNGKIRNATMYPAILVVLILLVMIVIFTFVLPSFFTMFDGMTLPLPTQVVIAISNFLVSNWLYLLIGILLFIMIVTAIFQQEHPKRWKDKMMTRIPKIGKLLRTIYTARFARTMASLYVSGIPMIQSLNIAKKTIGNSYIEHQFGAVIEKLANGQTLSQSLMDVDGFESKLKSTILIGEESGRLEQMLESVADQFDYDAEMASQRIVALIEPVLIVVMAVVIAFVMISVMLPIYQMYSSVGAEGGM